MLNILKKSEKKVWRRCEKRGTLQPSKLFKIEQLFPLKFFSENFFFLFGSFESFFLGFFPLSFENMNYHKKSGEKMGKSFPVFLKIYQCVQAGCKHFSLFLWARHPSPKPEQGLGRLIPSLLQSSLQLQQPPPPPVPQVPSPPWSDGKQ